MENTLISDDRLRSMRAGQTPQPAVRLDERQMLALNEWRRLSRNGQVPRRSDLRPERIARALPVAALIGVEWVAGHVTLIPRIDGMMVALGFGAERRIARGERLRLDHLPDTLPALDEAIREGRVTLTQVKARTAGGAKVEFGRLLLPFSSDDGRIVRLLAVYGFDTGRIANMRAPFRWTSDFRPADTPRARRNYLRLRTA